MSCVDVRSPEQSEYLSGPELHYICGLPDRFFQTSFGSLLYCDDCLMKTIERIASMEFDRTKNLDEQFFRHVSCGIGQGFRFTDGREAFDYDCSLNSIMTWGSKPAQFIGHLAAYAERKVWIEGKDDRRFFANIIEEGMGSGIMRQHINNAGIDEIGWPKVVDLLRNGYESRVVFSLSGTSHDFDRCLGLRRGGWKHAYMWLDKYRDDRIHRITRDSLGKIFFGHTDFHPNGAQLRKAIEEEAR